LYSDMLPIFWIQLIMIQYIVRIIHINAFTVVKITDP